MGRTANIRGTGKDVLVFGGMGQRKGTKTVAVYHGDDMVFMGTVQEAAEYLGVLPRTVRYYMTPTYQKRYEQYLRPERARYVVPVDDDE